MPFPSQPKHANYWNMVAPLLPFHRVGWLMLLQFCDLTGTWNADPNHIDYIPTRGMFRDDGDTTAINGFDATSLMDRFVCDSPCPTLDHTDTVTAGETAGSASILPPVSIKEEDNALDSTYHTMQHITTSRVPIMGVTSSQFHSTASVNSCRRRRPRKMSHKIPHNWSSSHTLTSSHFCKHRGTSLF